VTSRRSHPFARLAAPVSLVLMAVAARAQEGAGEAPAKPAEVPVTPREALSRRLEKHRYFSKIAWTVADVPGPILLALQTPPKERPNYDRSIAGFYLPWMETLEQVFVEHYAKPFGLERVAGRPPYAVCALLSEGDLFNYFKASFGAREAISWGHFDPELELVIVNGELGSAPAMHLRRAALSAFVIAMLHAHYSGPGARPPSAWLVHGLSDYLAYHLGITPETLRQRRVDPEWPGLVARAARASEVRDVALLSLAELLPLESASRYWSLVRAKSKALGFATPPDSYRYTYWAQSVLWMQYLDQAGEGRYRPAFGAYLKSALSGDGGLQAFRRAFGDVDLGELDRAVVRFALQQDLGANPVDPIDSAVIDGLFRGPAVALPAGPEPTASAAALAPDAGDLQAQHALALRRVLRGDIEGGLARLEELEDQARGGPLEGRIGRDRERTAGFARLRDTWLEELIESGAKLSFERNGRKISALVQAIEDGALRLETRRGEVEKLPLSELEPYEIARQMGRKQADSEDGWLRIWGYVLAGDARWEKLLKGRTQEESLLRADAQEWYPGLLRMGEAAELLEELAGLKADAAPELVLARVREMKPFEDLELVARRKAALRELAAGALERSFDPQAIDDLLAGRLERLGDGRARLTYEFDDPREREDFVLVPGYLTGWREAQGALELKPEDFHVAVEDGDLALLGQSGLACKVRFGTPFVARYVLRIDMPQVDSPHVHFALMALDDGRENQVACVGLGGLHAWDASREHHVTEYLPPEMYSPGRAYEFELRIAGGRAQSFRDGQPMRNIDAGSLQEGRVIAFVHSDARIRFDRLEIEGQLGDRAVNELRADWVESQLAELGL
jgi:hypothetical protein